MIDYMQTRNATVLEARLDKDQYNDDELISIKTPLNFPYYSISSDYERAYGSLEVNGTTYEYVKRRVHQDTLELLCLPDRTKMQLQSVENEFLKLAIGGTSTQNEKKPINLKLNFPDFFQDLHSFSIAIVSTGLTNYYSSNTTFLKADYSFIDEQPPKSMRPSI